MSINRSNINEAIAERIASDPEFRAELTSDPHTALASLAGMTIPESVRITIHEESAADIHLVIPAEAALSEDDLELVSGGYNWYPHNQGCSL